MISNIDLRSGRWQDSLSKLEHCDAVICDPPYGARTHDGGHSDDLSDGKPRQQLGYDCFTREDVFSFVEDWYCRCRGWFACMTSHDLIKNWIDAYESCFLYSFAPVVIKQPRVRLCGDGPSSCAVYLMVARPKTIDFSRWGALPGWYNASIERVDGIIGAKPVGLMRAIVRDYSKPGDIVVDPYAGSGSTLLAAAIEWRRAIGAEIDPKTYEIARARIARGLTPSLF